MSIDLILIFMISEKKIINCSEMIRFYSTDEWEFIKEDFNEVSSLALWKIMLLGLKSSSNHNRGEMEELY